MLLDAFVMGVVRSLKGMHVTKVWRRGCLYIVLEFALFFALPVAYAKHQTLLATAFSASSSNLDSASRIDSTLCEQG